jgi:hypothetical protein
MDQIKPSLVIPPNFMVPVPPTTPDNAPGIDIQDLATAFTMYLVLGIVITDEHVLGFLGGTFLKGPRERGCKLMGQERHELEDFEIKEIVWQVASFLIELAYFEVNEEMVIQCGSLCTFFLLPFQVKL